MSRNAWIIFATACVVLLGGLVYFSGKNRIDIGNVNPNAIQKATEQSGNIADHVDGNKNAKVILTEYGDYQCPGCGTAAPVIKAVTDKYSDQVAFVFRNLPLPSIHPNARAAASAAEAAGLQNRYFDMHDKLYENQADWESLSSGERTDKFVSYAQDLKLDVEKFKNDFGSDTVSQKIRFDEAVFGKTGLAKSTPTVIINGEKVDQEATTDQGKLDTLVAEAIKASGGTLPKKQ